MGAIVIDVFAFVFCGCVYSFCAFFVFGTPSVSMLFYHRIQVVFGFVVSPYGTPTATYPPVVSDAGGRSKMGQPRSTHMRLNMASLASSLSRPFRSVMPSSMS